MRPLVVSGWKMNLTSTEARSYLEALVPLVRSTRGGVEGELGGCDLVVVPPFTSIWVARDCLDGSGIQWGAQDVHPDDAGAHTGDVSAPMLADLGCSLVEVGHAERRRDYHETDELIGAKIGAVLRWGMTAMLCVGEEEPMSRTSTLDFLRRQVEPALAYDPARIVVAYEPVWAIGTGSEPADPAWVQDIHGEIHDWLGRGGTNGARVIYGGSVDSESAAEILRRPGVDGLGVGRSSLDPEVLATIVRGAAARRSEEQV